VEIIGEGIGMMGLEDGETEAAGPLRRLAVPVVSLSLCNGLFDIEQEAIKTRSRK
jgi:hypothetical protein